MVNGKALLAFLALVALRSTAATEKNFCLGRQDDLSCVPGGDTIELEACGITDDDLEDLAECFDKRGRGSIKSLNLNFNGLTHVPEDLFKGFDNLEKLFFMENQLSTLPAGIFDGLPLTYMVLYSNELSSLPSDVFSGLGASLQSLSLRDNKFVTVPVDLFHGLSSLETLSLGDNDLMGLPAQVFDGLTELQSLHLYRNAFTTLPAGLFDGLGKLTRLTLWDNEDLLCVPSTTGSPLLTADELELPSSDFDPTASCACPLEGEEGFCADDCTPGVGGFVCSGKTCDNGFPGISQGDICCEASCGTCGGEGCSGRGNGQDSCCTKKIAADGETCSVKGAAPCIMDGDVVMPHTPAPVTPTTGFSCSGDAGIQQGDICCEASCGTCGGVGCSGRGNGQDSCCTKNIAANDEACSVKGAAPCILDDDTVTPGGVGFSCSGDAGIVQGDICCEASCGTCGGVGCSGRGNGQDSCCTKNIAANGETCSVKGAAPCIVDDDTVTPGGYEEVGCYTDKSFPARIMVDVTSSSSMTIEACQVHCAGSAYFGVQYAIECWCSGTDSADYPYDIYDESTACTKACSGNEAELCGGDWAMNVYKNV